MVKFLKDGVINVIWGLVASAIAAYAFAPSTEVDFGSIGLTIAAIPLFLLLGLGGIALYSLYMIVNLVEFLAVKIGILDFFDGGDFGG